VTFDWSRLETLYGSSKNYTTKVNQNIDQLVKEKRLLESDAKRLRNKLIPPGETGPAIKSESRPRRRHDLPSVPNLPRRIFD
jgi:hypothetical protein